jgi:hypothetical protein
VNHVQIYEASFMIFVVVPQLVLLCFLEDLNLGFCFDSFPVPMFFLHGSFGAVRVLLPARFCPLALCSLGPVQVML